MSCGGEVSPSREVVLASTTSTEDSGLFDVLLPAFERAHPEYDVKLIAVGSGEALALGRRRDADVLLVHAPVDEEVFVREGHGATRQRVMANDFVVAGPAADPAAVRSAPHAAAALRRIADSGALFVSRGDNSGTHKKELELWTVTGPRPPSQSGWYIEVGQGMGDALRVANERQAYVLADRATYLFLSSTLDLVVLAEGDTALFNPYSVITVSGARNARGAQVFADWLVGEEAQTLIGRYGVERFGRALFVPVR
ncbi:MAG: substrate-binding domain-containing protein [Longimicrobiales bacterium]